MLSKSQIKLITSLQQKKYRNKLGLFVAEGPKVIHELITAGLRLYELFSVEEGLFDENEVQIISGKDLAKISSLKNANNSVAVFEIPKAENYSDNGLILVLDAIRDPGNLGTIIRLCDWFGVTRIVCSNDTVDCYNPKVIQATMGSIARLSIDYVDISEYIENSKLPVFSTEMNGENIYHQTLPEKAIIVLGNEANGISDEILNLATNKIAIPQFGAKQETESLNVATATAIVLSEFKRSIVPLN